MYAHKNGIYEIQLEKHQQNYENGCLEERPMETATITVVCGNVFTRLISLEISLFLELKVLDQRERRMAATLE